MKGTNNAETRYQTDNSDAIGRLDFPVGLDQRAGT
jgi:hypothetical protein